MKNIFNFLLGTMLFLSLTDLATAQTGPSIYNEQHTQVRVTQQSPEFTIKLKSNPTTGYSWVLNKYDNHDIYLIKHGFEAGKNKKLIGAAGHEVWHFQVKPAAFSKQHPISLRFIYARPWEKSKQATTVVFTVLTTEKHHS